MNLEELRNNLRHVRFIGGGSGAGKSTIAKLLAERYELRLYDTEQFSRYVTRTTPVDAPLLHSFMAMDMDERWLNRSPQLMCDTFHGFHGETFHVVIEDLLALPKTFPILAEGFPLLPRRVAPLLSRPGKAVWLIPTPDFRRAAFESRRSIWAIPDKTSNPEKALANLLARDRIFTDEVAREATALKLPVIQVDLGLTIDELVDSVAELLDFSGDVSGPC